MYVVCQADRPCEPLRKGRECSVEKAFRAAEQSRDEEVLAMFANYNFDTKYIGTGIVYIYQSTSEQSIRHATPSDRLKQTSQQVEDGVISSWTFLCLICKNKTCKKSRNLTNMCTFEACKVSDQRLKEKEMASCYTF